MLKFLCREGKVVLYPPDRPVLEISLARPIRDSRMISSFKVQKYLRNGGTAFLVSIAPVDSVLTPIEDLEVVREFPDVFPEELPGLPPKREIEFCIELLPGTTPISKAPYRMAPAELEELKRQLEELMEQGFIRNSASPWGAPVCS